MTENFDLYSKYYDLIYADKPYKSEAKYISDFLATQNIYKGDILEFGCGTGKHAEYFIRNNFTISGIELSEKMVANSFKHPHFNIVCGDIATTNFNQHFDTVISLFHVMSYQTTNEQLLNVFKNAYNHLKPGGYFIFDFWYTPAVFAEPPKCRIKKINNSTTSIFRVSEPTCEDTKNLVNVDFSVFIENTKTNRIDFINETHVMRHFGLPELELFSSFAGFNLVKCEEFLTGQPPSRESFGVCIFLQKPFK